MKTQHVIILGATYRPFDPAPDLADGLPEIEPPKNYVDAEKKAASIKKKTELRNEALADVWALKQFDSLRVCYDNGRDMPVIVTAESIDSNTDFVSLLAPVCDAIAAVDARDVLYI